MDNTIRNIILDLKIITLVEPNGRLYLSKDTLAVERNLFYTSVKRFIMGDSRSIVIDRIKQRISELNYLLKNNHIIEGWLILELKALIEPLKNGLTNIKMTYNDDSQTCATIDIIISQIINMNEIYLEKK